MTFEEKQEMLGKVRFELIERFDSLKRANQFDNQKIAYQMGCIEGVSKSLLLLGVINNKQHEQIQNWAMFRSDYNHKVIEIMGVTSE